MTAKTSSRNAREAEAWREQREAYRLLRARWHDDPVRYARERLGLSPTWQQRDLLEALQPDGAKVSIRSGHGTGKTGGVSAAICWFLETRDFPKIPCTAPTASQLRDVLWAELSKWFRKADQVSKARGDHPRLWLSSLFRLTSDRLVDRAAPGEWYAVARTSGRDNPDALQGFHASDVTVSDDGRGLSRIDEGGAGKIMFVVEEASGVFEKVFEVAEGALSSHGSRLLMVGNPTKTRGFFYDSHHVDRATFTSLHFRSDESPLADPDYRARLVRKYGEGSNIVRVRADGEFPKSEADGLIPLEFTEPAASRPQHEHAAQSEIRVGVDVARFGDDRTVITARQGPNVLEITIKAKQGTMQTAGQALNVAERLGAAGIYVDTVGVGAGVADRLRETTEIPVHDVNVSESAPDRDEAEAEAHRLRDWLWLEVKDWLELEEPSFAGPGVDPENAEDLAGELASVKYKIDSSGRLVVESKDDMKKRLGHSPDIADSLGVTFYEPASGVYATGGNRTF